ncbi:mucin-associated surface protein (MASP), partial [Trypanosoma cruzi]
SGLKRYVRAVRASTQPRGHVYVYCGLMYKVRENIIVFCFVCLRCHAVCSALLPHIRHVERIPDTILCMHSRALSVFFFSFFNYSFFIAFKLLVCLAVCEFCNSTDFICLVVCALRLDGTVRVCAVAVRGVEAVSLPSPCVDVLLVCAEGYTQVTGVMAMMMTGRVLLVCALCVLWCGVGGRCDAGVGVGAQQDGGKSPPESKGLEASSQGTQHLKG